MPTCPTTMPMGPSQTAAFGANTPVKPCVDGDFNGARVKLERSAARQSLALVLFLDAVVRTAQSNDFNVGVIALADRNGRLIGIALMIWPRDPGHRTHPDGEDRCHDARPHAGARWSAPQGTASQNIPRHNPYSSHNADNAHVPPNRRSEPPPTHGPNHGPSEPPPNPTPDPGKRWTPENYHELLGVTKGETDIAKLEKARRQLALKYHPDRWTTKSAAERAVAEETMKEINAAFDAMKADAEEAQRQSA